MFKKIILGVAVIILGIALSGCGGSVEPKQPAAPAVPPAPTTPAETPTETPTPSPTDTEEPPLNQAPNSSTEEMAVGSTVTVDDGMGNVEEVTVQSVVFRFQGCDEFSNPEEGKKYLRLIVRYEAISGDENSYNPFDWRIRSDDGEEYTEPGITDCSSELQSGTLHGKVKGRVYIVVPKTLTHGLVIYDNMISQASWSF